MYWASATNVFLRIYEFFKNSRSSHRRSSVKKVFLKISQYSQENTCVWASLMSFESTLLKRDSNTDIFTWILQKFLRTPILKNIWERLHLKQLFQRTLVSSCFCISSFMKVIYKNVMKKVQSIYVKKLSTLSEKKWLGFNIIFKINKLLGYYNIKMPNGFFEQSLQKRSETE